MPLRFCAVLLLFLVGCKPAAPQGNLLLSAVKQALADRDAMLTGYELKAQVTDGEQRARHTFYFRSPNRMRVVITEPAPLQWVFDGARLHKLEPDAKAFRTYELQVSQQKAATFLHSMFSPFVLEGFRTPLMPMKGVTATEVAHPKGPRAVELRVTPGDGVTVTYVLRWPGADFLERRTQTATGRSELKVEDEQCFDKPKLCVPKRAVEVVDGKLHLTTQVSAIALNPELAADVFAPPVPEGWTLTTQTVVEDPNGQAALPR